MGNHEFTGKTVESAIQKGLKSLGLSREEVEIKILDEGQVGLFGLMGASSAKVRITPKNLSPEIKEESPVSSKGALDSLQKEMQAIIKNILDYMDIDAQIEALQGEERVLVNIKTDSSSILIGRKGQTLNALEFLLSIITNKEQEHKIRISLDVDGYRARREDFLLQLADNIAKEVIEKKEPRKLLPMIARERRIIHLALKENPLVQTYSEGEGRDRKVVISPTSSSPTTPTS